MHSYFLKLNHNMCSKFVKLHQQSGQLPGNSNQSSSMDIIYESACVQLCEILTDDIRTGMESFVHLSHKLQDRLEL